MTRYICVHGHAYQPPRENPNTGEIDQQPTAAPFRNWNERINSECYEPLATARVLRSDGQPEQRLNLWASLSFDLGPTLGTWMDRHAPATAAAVTSGDVSSGGTAAMAHPWVHAILPLTNARDRSTIVNWGLAEFTSRFGRQASGMWLPETAVDSASLETLVDHGISWTMLAPHQCHPLEAFHPIQHSSDTPGSTAQAGSSEMGEPPRTPLLVHLPSGRSIAVIPYDGPTSHAVAFGGLLNDGVRFAHAVVDAAADGLTIVSTDIESFGHHHRFGEMALARAVIEWSAMAGVELIRPAEYLARFPAVEPGAISELSSWSCAHGVERWRSNCGCRFEEVAGQDQSWRRPLRDVLDVVAEQAGRALDGSATRDLIDPWNAREEYGAVLSAPPDLREQAIEQFLDSHSVARSSQSDQRCLQWMNAERLRLEAWSSCAWFFDAPDRIETLQSIRQAGSACAQIDALCGTNSRLWFDQVLRATGLVQAP